MTKYKLKALLLVSFWCLSNWSLADNGMYPNIGADLTATLQDDLVRSRAAGKTLTTNGTVNINPITHFRFSPDDEIWLDAALNQINAGTERHQYFEDIGLTINQLNYYRYADNYWLRAGKFNDSFGRASIIAPGLYTANLTDNYIAKGVIGGELAFTLWNNTIGVIQPITSVYFTDTSILSRSFFQKSKRVSESDGGPANTGELNSASLAVNWFSIPALPFLQIQAGYKQNHKGLEDSANEKLATLSARYIFVIPPSSRLGPTLNGKYFDIVPFIEYVAVKNNGGIRNQKAYYLTTSLSVDYGFWLFGLTRTYMGINNSSPDNTSAYLNELSVQYSFTNLLTIKTGIGSQKMGGERSTVFGLSLNYIRRL